MALTFHDICNRLKHVDEISLLELLDITSEDIVDRFADKIETNLDYFVDDLESDDYET